MINLNNYESWFLQYADGECSPAEKQAVEAFLLLHPELNEELGLIMEMRLEPVPLSMPDKESLRFGELELLNEQYKLQPDLSIVFRDKKSLYKRERSRVIPLYRALSAAAVLLFGIGLYWMLSGESAQPEVAVGPADRINPQVSAPAAESSASVVVATGRTVKSEKAGASRYSAVPDQSQISSDQPDPVIPADMVARLEESLPMTESRKPAANLSEDALKAAQARMDLIAVAEPVALPLNAAAILHDVQKENEKKPLRSFMRTLSRRILHDEEADEGKEYIQVANFHIHVKN